MLGLAARARDALEATGAELGFAVGGDLDQAAAALAAHLEASGPDRWRAGDDLDVLDHGVQAAAAAVREAERLLGD